MLLSDENVSLAMKKEPLVCPCPLCVPLHRVTFWAWGRKLCGGKSLGLCGPGDCGFVCSGYKCPRLGSLKNTNKFSTVQEAEKSKVMKQKELLHLESPPNLPPPPLPLPTPMLLPLLPSPLPLLLPPPLPPWTGRLSSPCKHSSVKICFLRL